MRHTVPLLMAVGSRLPDRHAWLRDAVLHYLEEETGHDEWILNDIEAAGGDRAAAAASQPAVATEAMIAYAYDTVMRRNPVGFFGMVHVLEGTSVSLALTRGGSHPVERSDCPRAHSPTCAATANSTRSTSRTWPRILERLTDREDREAVLRCAKGIYWFYGQVFRIARSRGDIGGPAESLRKTA